MSVLKVKRNGVWEVVSGLAGGASNGATVYVQDDEPANASVGTLWLDTDEESGGGSGGAAADIPTFNLSEMGLPAIPFDGTEVEVSIDCAELREALALGMVKIIAAGEYRGETINIIRNVNAVYDDYFDSYTISFTFAINIRGDYTIYHCNAFITDTIIYATIFPMQMMLPDAEEATF